MAVNVNASANLTRIAEPLGGNKFWVEIKGILEGYFTDCTGLTATTEVMPYKEGGQNKYIHQLPVRTSFSNITLKRGYTQSPTLWNWYLKTVKGEIERENFSIMLFTTDGKPARRWEVSNAYPIKWTGPELKVKDNTFLVETIEIVHTGFEVVL